MPCRQWGMVPPSGAIDTARPRCPCHDAHTVYRMVPTHAEAGLKQYNIQNLVVTKVRGLPVGPWLIESWQLCARCPPASPMPFWLLSSFPHCSQAPSACWRLPASLTRPLPFFTPSAPPFSKVTGDPRSRADMKRLIDVSKFKAAIVVCGAFCTLRWIWKQPARVSLDLHSRRRRLGRRLCLHSRCSAFHAAALAGQHSSMGGQPSLLSCLQPAALMPPAGCEPTSSLTPAATCCLPAALASPLPQTRTGSAARSGGTQRARCG